MAYTVDWPRIILASGSPRRRELLAALGIPFLVVEPDVDEQAVEVPGDPAALVLARARTKAQAVGRRYDGLIVGADTVVVVDGQVLGKPAGPKEAEQMLQRLSGHRHDVYTGLVVLNSLTHEQAQATEVTRVWMRRLSPEQIRTYVATGEPLDKAGAYAVQGLGSLLVERIDGCFYNVVGLPLMRLSLLLSHFGIDLITGAGVMMAQGGPGPE